MRILDHFKRGKPNEPVEERTPGKTYREGDLQVKKPFRQTSVSAGTFVGVKVLISVIIGAVVVGAIGYYAYYYFQLAMGW